MSWDVDFGLIPQVPISVIPQAVAATLSGGSAIVSASGGASPVLIGVNSGTLSLSGNQTTVISSGGSIPTLYQILGNGNYYIGGFGDGFSTEFYDQFLPASGTASSSNASNYALNISGQTASNYGYQDHTNGVSTNTGIKPAIMNVYITTPDAGLSGYSLATAQAAATAHANAGGIVRFSILMTSRTTGGIAGASTDFPNIITPGTATYNKYMYGSGGPSAPNGGIWAIAQFLLQFFANTNNKSCLARLFWENNLDTGSWWFGTNGVTGSDNAGANGPSNAHFVTFLQQTINYIRSILGSTLTQKILFDYNSNGNPGGYAQNDPGQSYCAISSVDYYYPNTFSDTSTGVTQDAFVYHNARGNPVLIGECGNNTSGNGSGKQFTFDVSIWRAALRTYNPKLCGMNLFCQMWHPSVQNNFMAMIAGGIVLSNMPVFQ
jgi:hypothetical protein